MSDTPTSTHRNITITRWTKADGFNKQPDAVAAERTVTISIAGTSIARLQCLPCDLEDLAIGFAVTNGLVENVSDITDAKISDDGSAVELDVAGIDKERLKGAASRLVLAAGCGKAVFAPEIGQRISAPEGSGFSAEEILAAVRDLSSRGEVFDKTGSVHSAAAWTRDGLVAFREDIARHNAVDKIAGAVLRAGGTLRGCLLVSSGRMTTEVVTKGIRLGVWGIASRSAATDRAVMLAAELGMVLVGFIRGGRMNIYCGATRLAR